jgi:hypothetical protein
MPFDGKCPGFTESRETRAVLMLDYLLEFFGTGEAWYKYDYTGPNGSRCLVQAMQDVNRRHRLKGHNARAYILRAVQETTSYRGLIAFNNSCDSYAELEAVLWRARELAARANAYA